MTLDPEKHGNKVSEKIRQGGLSRYTKFVILCFKVVGIGGGSIAIILFVLSLFDVLFKLNAGFGIWGMVVTAGGVLFFVSWYKLGCYIERELSGL